MSEKKAGLFKRIWQALLRRSPLFVLVLGAVAGIVFWGGFNTALEVTNSVDFCISCHEMRSTVYPEYQQTVHYKNRSGVQATCPDCHVPKTWIHKIARKIQASNELYHSFMGTIDTREKFEARRWYMANRVWKTMRETDSRECRNCHSLANMDLNEQDRSARKKHARAAKQGKTCIDCHQGIAHEYPDEPEEEEEEAANQ